VSLVYEVGKPGPAKRPMDGWLRMLALFSLPTEASALALRRERYALTRLVRRLAARDGRAVELQVLQYGVTRDRLAEAMTAGGGPDVLHVSGHGRTGELLLEKPDGTADPVPADQLLRLLAPARERVKLAVVSACESAAGRLAETLGLLGLTEAATQAQQQADAETRPAPESGIAHRVARELDCAVVAMRYPVTDEFAIALAGGCTTACSTWTCRWTGRCRGRSGPPPGTSRRCLVRRSRSPPRPCSAPVRRACC
jgi:hypothetical protein